MNSFPKVLLLLLGSTAMVYFSAISALDTNFLIKEGLMIFPLQVLALGYVVWFNRSQGRRDPTASFKPVEPHK
jgi:hypothetical protein